MANGASTGVFVPFGTDGQPTGNVLYSQPVASQTKDDAPPAIVSVNHVPVVSRDPVKREERALHDAYIERRRTHEDLVAHIQTLDINESRCGSKSWLAKLVLETEQALDDAHIAWKTAAHAQRTARRKLQKESIEKIFFDPLAWRILECVGAPVDF